jgi:DNA-binding SARP family transcriptional activator
VGGTKVAAAGIGPGEGFLQLRLLGGFGLTFEGGPVELPYCPQRLIAFLALHERPLQRVYVAGTLWPDTTEPRACANLRSALWRVRAYGHGVVLATGLNLRLDPALRVDLTEAVAAAHRLLAGSPEQPDLGLARAFGGDLLPDWYDEWVQSERERFRQLRLHALEALAERMIDAGRYGEAADACLSAVSADPLRESAYRVLIKLHVAEGNWSEALRQYDVYSHLLRTELGLRPSPHMKELLLALPRDGRTARRAAFASSVQAVPLQRL